MFDGRRFVARDFYTQGGLFRTGRPRLVDRTVDLGGRFVVPPFGEAHNHNVDWAGEDQFARLRQMYLRDGIFYVKNPTNLPRARLLLQGRINIPSSIDAIFANGGLTGSGGHPVEIVRRNFQRGGMTEADGEGGFYHTIDDIGDLDAKWPGILAGHPDFIKTTLVYSEEYERRRSDEAFFGRRGLNPALMPEIVRRAHAAGLAVTCHIETLADFRYAVRAGVDEVAHMPGFAADERLPMSTYRLDDADARLARHQHVVAVTTLGEALDFVAHGNGSASSIAIRDMIANNLRRLKQRGIPLAIGSDQFRETSLPEIMKLRTLGLFSNLELLKMWCETTAAAIFPHRRIGRLTEGFEASFLVLAGDPLIDFENVRAIELRVKQGEVLTL